MENKEYGSIIGSRSAPYINSLAGSYVLLTRAYAVSHPSLPNYLALTSGSTHGLRSNCTTCYKNGRNIVDQLAAHHMGWKAYMQSMPRACFTGSSAGRGSQQYAKRHNPFMYYNDVRTNAARCHRVVPFTRFPGDLRRGLPRFAWITPNLCNDMHSCSVATGDAFLRAWIPRILPKLGPRGILILAFDEGFTHAGCCGVRSGGGHVAAVIAGPGAKQGVQLARSVNHYSILRLIERAWGFAALGHARARRTPSIIGWSR